MISTNQQALLGRESQDDGDNDSDILAATDITILDLQQKIRTLRRCTYVLALLYGILTVAYVIHVLGVLKFGDASHCASCPVLQQKDPAAAIFPSLAKSGALQYENRIIDVRLHDNAFTGPPRPELDWAWHELFESEKLPLLIILFILPY